MHRSTRGKYGRPPTLERELIRGDGRRRGIIENDVESDSDELRLNVSGRTRLQSIELTSPPSCTVKELTPPPPEPTVSGMPGIVAV